MPAYADYGITENPCWPKVLIDDPGFALLAGDSWYGVGATGSAFDARTLLYKNLPPAVSTSTMPASRTRSCGQPLKRQTNANDPECTSTFDEFSDPPEWTTDPDIPTPGPLPTPIPPPPGPVPLPLPVPPLPPPIPAEPATSTTSEAPPDPTCDMSDSCRGVPLFEMLCCKGSCFWEREGVAVCCPPDYICTGTTPVKSSPTASSESPPPNPWTTTPSGPDPWHSAPPNTGTTAAPAPPPPSPSPAPPPPNPSPTCNNPCRGKALDFSTICCNASDTCYWDSTGHPACCPAGKDCPL